MDWSQIILVILGSSVVAIIVTKIFDYFTEKRKNEEERRQKLYGPLTYKLIVMDLLNINQTNLIKEITGQIFDYKERHTSFVEDVSPLVKQWQACVKDIRELFEKYPGYIKEEDMILVKDFLDGYIKREIIKNGTSKWTNADRIEKLLVAIQSFKDRLLP